MLQHKNSDACDIGCAEQLTQQVTEQEIERKINIQTETQRRFNEKSVTHKLSVLFDSIKAKIPYSDIENTVFYDGNINAKIMLVGEAPGAQEVVEKKPFVGRSGKLLREMLNAADLKIDDIYITNIMPWRPPMNRPPLLQEMLVMQPIVDAHINIIKPTILVLIGGISYKTVMQDSTPISRIRGQWLANNLYPKTKIISTYHPSFLLRAPYNKRHAWEDLISIRLAASPPMGPIQSY